MSEHGLEVVLHPATDLETKRAAVGVEISRKLVETSKRLRVVSFHANDAIGVVELVSDASDIAAPGHDLMFLENS